MPGRLGAALRGCSASAFAAAKPAAPFFPLEWLVRSPACQLPALGAPACMLACAAALVRTAAQWAAAFLHAVHRGGAQPYCCCWLLRATQLSAILQSLCPNVASLCPTVLPIMRATLKTCRRYLRATGGDQKHAAKRIHDTLEWRRAEQPEHIVCTACRANHKSHYMQVVGHDLTGRCAEHAGRVLCQRWDAGHGCRCIGAVHSGACGRQAAAALWASVHAFAQAAIRHSQRFTCCSWPALCPAGRSSTAASAWPPTGTWRTTASEGRTGCCCCRCWGVLHTSEGVFHASEQRADASASRLDPAVCSRLFLSSLSLSPQAHDFHF